MIHIAKQPGAFMIETSSTKNKDFIIDLGADEHIDYRSQPFEDVAENIDFVLDTVGRDNIDRPLEVLFENLPV